MKKLYSFIFLTIALAGIAYAAQVAIVSIDTRNESWSKETLNNTDLQTNIDGKQGTDTNLDTLATPTNWRLFYSNGSATLIELALGLTGTVLTSNGAAAAPTFEVPLTGFAIEISGGGSAITTGELSSFSVPYDCTITRVSMLADQTGSIVVDLWKGTYADYPLSDADSITGSTPPTISAAIKSEDETFTGWTTLSVTKGDVITPFVDSAATIEKLTINIEVSK